MVTIQKREDKELNALDCKHFSSWSITKVHICLSDTYNEDDEIFITVVRYWHKYEKYLEYKGFKAEDNVLSISGREEDADIEIYDSLEKYKNRNKPRR